MMLQDCSEITVEQFHAMHQQRLQALVKKHRRAWTRECHEYYGPPPRKVRHGSKVYRTPLDAALAHGVSEQCIREWCKMKLNGWERI